MFQSVQDLAEYITANGKYVMVSKQKKLRQIHILLLSLANGDFNAAHCQPGFSHISFFKGIVSQGIGVVARAEGEFLQLMRFAVPPEVIATGIDSLRYFSPLRWGDVYTYTFEISNLRKTKRMWKADCSITSAVKGETDRLVAKWDWRIGFIEHQDHAAPAEVQMLQPKSYFRNVLENFVVRPVTHTMTAATVAAAIVWGIWPAHFLALGALEAKSAAAHLLYGTLLCM